MSCMIGLSFKEAGASDDVVIIGEEVDEISASKMIESIANLLKSTYNTPVYSVFYTTEDMEREEEIVVGDI